MRADEDGFASSFVWLLVSFYGGDLGVNVSDYAGQRSCESVV